MMPKTIYITCRRDGYHYYDRPWKAGETLKARIAKAPPKSRTDKGCDLVISEREYRVHSDLLQRFPNHPIAFLNKAPEAAPALADRTKELNEQSRELAKLGAEAKTLRQEVETLTAQKTALQSETEAARDQLDALQAKVIELEKQAEELEG